MQLQQIFQLSADELDKFKKWYEMIRQPSRLKRWKKYEKLCPVFNKNIIIDGKQRIITLEYNPVLKNEVFHQLLILVTDITEKIKTEESLKTIEKEIHKSHKSDVCRKPTQNMKNT